MEQYERGEENGIESYKSDNEIDEEESGQVEYVMEAEIQSDEMAIDDNLGNSESEIDS